jgi:hypothetical protein
MKMDKLKSMLAENKTAKAPGMLAKLDARKSKTRLKAAKDGTKEKLKGKLKAKVEMYKKK